MDNEYCIICKFSSLESLQAFTRYVAEYKNATPAASLRSQTTKALHQKAKEHRKNNPKLTYKECLKAVAKQ
jgi:hypothetical protein